MYRPKRAWAWDERAEQQYKVKRERLAELAMSLMKMWLAISKNKVCQGCVLKTSGL